MEYLMLRIQLGHFKPNTLSPFTRRHPLGQAARRNFHTFPLEVPPSTGSLTGEGESPSRVEARLEDIVMVVRRNYLDPHLQNEATDHVWLERMCKKPNLRLAPLRYSTLERWGRIVPKAPWAKRSAQDTFPAGEPRSFASLRRYSQEDTEEGERIVAQCLLLDVRAESVLA